MFIATMVTPVMEDYFSIELDIHSLVNNRKVNRKKIKTRFLKDTKNATKSQHKVSNEPD